MEESMIEKRKIKRHLVVLIISLAQLVFAVAFMIYGAFTHIITGTQGDLVVAASLVIFWALMDVVEPLLVGRFENLTVRRKNAYLKFAAFDLAGLAGIAYFLFSMNGSSNSGILGAAVYVVSIKLKRENQDIFYGYKTEEEEKKELPDEPENME